MTTHFSDPWAQALAGQLNAYLIAHPDWAYKASMAPYESGRSPAEALAVELMDHVALRELKVATLLDSPDGQLLQTIAERALGWPYSQGVPLLVDALHLAVEADQRGQRKTAALWTVGIVAAAAALVWLATHSDG